MERRHHAAKWRHRGRAPRLAIDRRPETLSLTRGPFSVKNKAAMVVLGTRYLRCVPIRGHSFCFPFFFRALQITIDFHNCVSFPFVLKTTEKDQELSIFFLSRDERGYNGGVVIRFRLFRFAPLTDADQRRRNEAADASLSIKYCDGAADR